MTVRECINDALALVKAGGSVKAVGKLHEALNLLDGSREVTEKVTTSEPAFDNIYGPVTRHSVKNHKARVVLDD